jgi:hypothetical protein
MNNEHYQLLVAQLASIQVAMVWVLRRLGENDLANTVLKDVELVGEQLYAWGINLDIPASAQAPSPVKPV